VRTRSASALACLLLLPAVLCGQRYSFKRYDQSSGLPNQNVRALLQDRTGFLWIGTDNGLYRYDGRRYRTFSTADGLPAARVEVLHQTNDGTIWVSTSSGLARLRGERFEAVEVPSRGMTALASDGLGRLYAGGGKGLMVSGTAASAARTPEFRVYPNPMQASQMVKGIAVSDTGVVWYGCGRQLCRLDGGHVDSRADWGVPDDLWESVLSDPKGNVWARSRTMLIELPKGEARFQRRDRDLPPAATDGELLLGRDGQLWVPTIRGLARRTATGWDIIGKSRGLPVSSVECVLEDREGSIWIGLNGGGLVRWLGFPNWESWTEAEGLSAESTWALQRDGAGVLWSINDVGLNRFNETSRRWEELKLPGLPAAQTTALMPVPDGSLWVGQVSGALQIDRGRGHLTAYGRESGLSNPWITTEAFDHQGRVWLGTPSGLYHSVSDGAGSPITLRFERETLPLERGPDFVLTSQVDRKGRLWVGTTGGLLRLEAGRWTRFTTSAGLLHNSVAHLGEASDGSLWVAYMEPVGVSHLIADNGEHPNWRHFSLKDGLRSKQCYFVGCDSRGWVWFGTDKGVDVFDGSSFRHFDHTDGLAWDDTAGNAFWADFDGSIWIGTSRGISHVRIPNKGLPERPEYAPVLLTSAEFGDQNMNLNTGFSVPWSQRSLHIGFAAMTFVNEETLRFRYRIAGLEDRWSETGLSDVHIPSLPAGRYTFEVQADAGQGAWAGAPARIAFAIRAAWWRTWWFDFAALAAVALLAHQLWVWRLRAILRRQEELEDAVADRTHNLLLEKLRAETQKVEIERLFRESQQAARLKDHFLANMSHEIRTPLNGIMGMTALALGTPLAAEHRESWETVRISSESLVGIVDDIMDFSKIEAGEMDWSADVFDLHELVNASARSVALLARQKHLKVLCQIASSVPRRMVGDPLRVRQVLINLLKNAVKFTERGQIVLRLDIEEGTDRPLLHFEVADTRDRHLRGGTIFDL
jgi:signal transduction histidine kinase/ligand-binding sensor domain-containing protein